MERLKKEIRDNTKQQAKNSNWAQFLTEKLQTLAEEGGRIANEERVLQSLKFDEWERRFNVVTHL